MILSNCPTCNSEIRLPDPPSHTKEENITFRKAWDQRVEQGQEDQELATRPTFRPHRTWVYKWHDGTWHANYSVGTMRVSTTHNTWRDAFEAAFGIEQLRRWA